ncbi:MAG TPA: PqqD family peptide modification chaperone [Mobilitalea sp.]|nr:PqqD family peptide modification chaperone [Mobilitalea sp.]
MGLKVKVLRKPEVSDLAGEKVMIDFETGKYFMLKGVANDIWDMLEDGITAEAISESLLKEYDVDEKTCLESVSDFLNVMKEKGLISLV